MSIIAGFKAVIPLYLLTATLVVLLPGRIVTGYACNSQTGKPLRYKLNGLFTLAVVVVTWLMFGDLTYLAENFYSAVFAANVLGLAGSSYLYNRGREIEPEKREAFDRCPTSDRPEKRVATKEELEKEANRRFFATFFLGQEFNPRFSFFPLFDIKMFLYVIGAVMLLLNVYSAAVLQKRSAPDNKCSTGSIVYSWLFTHFVVEYLFFEEIHLYTYDLFAEKLGFKLFWGCMVFYPFFYAVGSRFLINSSPSTNDMSIPAAIMTVTLFYLGWFLTRGSNLQKFHLKTKFRPSKAPARTEVDEYFNTKVVLFDNFIPSKKTDLDAADIYAKFYLFETFKILEIEQVTINNRLLISGFWGVSRHVNYLGETIQSIALSIPGVLVSGSPLPLLYAIYYVGLFVTREIDDDKICEKKYGEVWTEYKKRVPYRIVPLIW